MRAVFLWGTVSDVTTSSPEKQRVCDYEVRFEINQFIFPTIGMSLGVIRDPESLGPAGLI
jgi:hypothetical protein